MAYSRDLDNQHNAIYIYDYTNKKNNPVTHGFYECNGPVFDPEGTYLYFYTNQSFKPNYSDIDNTFIYSNSTQIAVVSLKKETPSLLAPKNDTVAMSAGDVAKDDKDKNKKDSATAKKPEAKATMIDFDGIEQRIELLPPAAGNYNALAVVKGKIIFIRYPNTGAPMAKEY
jgi:tricorn protease